MEPTLTERQRRERETHDRFAREQAQEPLLITESFEAPTAQENRFILEHFGSLDGKRILDLGAGMGEAALYFAQRGARVDALDISPGQTEILSREAQRRALDVRAHVVAAETLPFEDGTFDLVYGNGVLHHVDIRASVPEVRRVLKPGGRFAFIEPLAYNPVIWVYRRMASDVRTADERPLDRGQIEWICRQFPKAEHREFWIAALGLFMYFWAGERVSPSEDRYWKKVLRDGQRYARAVAPLFALDRALSRIPAVRFLAWNTVIYGNA